MRYYLNSSRGCFYGFLRKFLRNNFSQSPYFLLISFYFDQVSSYLNWLARQRSFKKRWCLIGDYHQEGVKFKNGRSVLYPQLLSGADLFIEKLSQLSIPNILLPRYRIGQKVVERKYQKQINLLNRSNRRLLSEYYYHFG